jgi:hypothetical protein
MAGEGRAADCDIGINFRSLTLLEPPGFPSQGLQFSAIRDHLTRVAAPSLRFHLLLSRSLSLFFNAILIAEAAMPAKTTFEVIGQVMTFLADSVTTILGIMALYSLLFHRDKLVAFSRLLAHTLINERVKKIKGALARLDSLNYEYKENKKEVIALLGELAGMIRRLAHKNSAFKECYDELRRHFEGASPAPLSEAAKRQLSQQLHAVLDEQSLGDAVTLLEDTHGTTRN